MTFQNPAAKGRHRPLPDGRRAARRRKESRRAPFVGGTRTWAESPSRRSPDQGGRPALHAISEGRARESKALSAPKHVKSVKKPVEFPKSGQARRWPQRRTAELCGRGGCRCRVPRRAAASTASGSVRGGRGGLDALQNDRCRQHDDTPASRCRKPHARARSRAASKRAAASSPFPANRVSQASIIWHHARSALLRATVSKSTCGLIQANSRGSTPRYRCRTRLRRRQRRPLFAMLMAQKSRSCAADCVAKCATNQADEEPRQAPNVRCYQSIGVGRPVPKVAERQGFEPWRRFPAYTRSRRAPSTTRPPLRRVLLNRFSP